MEVCSQAQSEGLGSSLVSERPPLHPCEAFSGSPSSPALVTDPSALAQGRAQPTSLRAWLRSFF